jgi:hypothetical protein
LLGTLMRIPVCRMPPAAAGTGERPHADEALRRAKIVDLIERCQAVQHGSPLVS